MNFTMHFFTQDKVRQQLQMGVADNNADNDQDKVKLQEEK